MLKRVLFISLIANFATFSAAFAQTLEPTDAPETTETIEATSNLEIVRGTVKEIAEDASYIVIDGTKIIATKEFLEDSNLELGDKVEIVAEKTEQGLKAIDYNYTLEEELGPSEPEVSEPEVSEPEVSEPEGIDPSALPETQR